MKTYKTLLIERHDAHAHIILNNGKVNAISTQLSSDLRDACLELKNNHSIKGVILQGKPGSFSAGMDVQELADPDREKGVSFWVAYFEMLQAIARFSKPFICAINGYAPAGATTITICADYSVMAKGDKFRVGLHEFKMSMQIPEIMCDLWIYCLGEKRAWKAVQNAELFTSDQALNLGIIDASVDIENVLPHAEQQLFKLINVHPDVFAQSKLFFRKKLHNILHVDPVQKAEQIITFMDKPELKSNVVSFLKKLKKK